VRAKPFKRFKVWWNLLWLMQTRRRPRPKFDCYAAELAMRTGATLVTADPEFARLGKQLKILTLPRHSA
jgi:predicted nucleic acid-binding protein